MGNRCDAHGAGASYGPRSELILKERFDEYRRQYVTTVFNALSEAAKRAPDARGPELVRIAAALAAGKPPPAGTTPKAKWTH